MPNHTKQPPAAHELLETDKMEVAIDEVIREEIDRDTPKHIAKVLYEGTQAKITVTAKHKGKITDEKEYVDHPTRINAADKLALYANLRPRTQINLNHDMTENTARIMRDIIDGISRGKIPPELADEEQDE